MLALIVGSLLSGCVVVVDGAGHDRDRDDDTWVQRDHRRHDDGQASGLNQVSLDQDRELARQLESSFDDDLLLESSDITAVVRGDVVTLHGRVADLAAFDRVVEITTSTDGVQRVVSRLIIEIEG